MPVPAGSSNITISSRFRNPPAAPPSALNLGPPPGSGGAIVKVTPQSQALIPRAKPALPAFNLPPFAEPPPPPQQIYFTKQPTLNPRPLPDLANLKKPPPPPSQPTPLTIPKGAPVVAVAARNTIVGFAPRAGLIGLAALVWIHDVEQLIKLYKLSQPESKPQSLPLRGGQSPGAGYLISGTITEICANNSNFDNAIEITWTFDQVGPSRAADSIGVYRGPIEVVSKVGSTYGGHFQGFVGLKTANFSSSFNITTGEASIPNAPTIANRPYCKLTSIDLVAIPAGRTEPEPEPKPQLQPKRAPVKSAVTGPDALPQFLDPPAPRRKLDIVPNLAPPPADKPLESNKKIPITITTPGAAPITITSPGAAPITISPTGQPVTIKITRPFAVPTPTGTAADPTTKPTIPAAVPLAVSSPGSTPTNLVMPGGGPITITAPGQEPITFDPSTGKSTGVQAAPNQKPSAFVSTPIAPATSPTTSPKPVMAPATPTTSPFPAFKDKDLQTIGLQLVGVTQLLQGLATNTTPSALKDAVCETTKPQGCTTNAIDKGVSKGNEDLKQFLTNQLPNVIGSGANAAIGADTNARVRKIEGDTAKIRESSGSDRYPMVLPEYLLDDFIDKPVQIPDQVAYNVWLLKQIDALVGLFPIKIERTDENGQKQMLKFENIAEAIAELTGLLAQIAFDADTAVNIGTRATGEAVGAKAAALQAGSYLKAITDYMGFQGQAVSIDVPISVTPGAVGLDGKLQESELKDFGVA